MEKSGNGKGSIKSIFLLMMIFMIGLAIFSYPFVSNWLADRRASMLIGGYERNVSYMSPAEIEVIWNKAAAYNNALRGVPVQDPFIQGSGVQLPKNYLEILNTSEVMAYIEIPKINVKLPIYHGVSQEVLKKGIGHMEGSSFPIGGSGTHCLLTGHTGLPEAKLFTDLTKLEMGDQFYIQVLGKGLIYQVDQISVIEPDDLGNLYTAPGEDYITMITCTPYGVNSHRLLVRGTRMNQMEKSLTLAKTYSWIYLVLFVLSMLLCITLFWICRRDNRRKKQSMSGMEGEQ